MFAFDHVLVGMDGQDPADAAIKAAARLAKLSGARLEVIHAVNMRRPFWWAEDERHWAKTQAEVSAEVAKKIGAHLGELLTSIGEPAGRADEVLCVVHGRPSAVLAKRAAEAGSSLLLLGRRSEHGLFDFGGTAREILARIPCPVWVQPVESAEPTEIRKIVVPIDLGPGASAIFGVADSLAQSMGAALDVIHCFEKPRSSFGYAPKIVFEDYRKTVCGELDRFIARVAPGREVTRRVVDGTPTRVILDMQDEADLIVMGTHGHSTLAQVMMGSEACNILKRAEKPVVVVPQQLPPQSEIGNSSTG